MVAQITFQPIKYIHIDTISPDEPFPCDLYLKAISAGKAEYTCFKREGERLGRRRRRGCSKGESTSSS